MEPKEIRASWNRIAEPYQRRWRRRTDVVQYGAFEPDESQLLLLGQVAGKRILDAGPEAWNWEDKQSEVTAPLETYRHTIGETIGDLSRAGFAVERMVEPEATAENVELTEEQISRFALIPRSIIWKTRAVELCR